MGDVHPTAKAQPYPRRVAGKQYGAEPTSRGNRIAPAPTVTRRDPLAHLWGGSLPAESPMPSRRRQPDSKSPPPLECPPDTDPDAPEPFGEFE